MSVAPVPAPPFRKNKRSRREFFRACRFLWPHKKLVAVSVVCAIMTGAFTAMGLGTVVPLLRMLVSGQSIRSLVDAQLVDLKEIPFYLRVLDRIADLMPTHPVAAVAAVFLIFMVIATLGSVTRFFQELLSDKSAIFAINDARLSLYQHTLRLPIGHFARFGTGDATARLVTDAQNLQDGFKAVLGKAVQEPITALFALGVAVLIDWRVTIFIVVFAPAMVYVVRKFGTKVRRAMRASLEKNSIMLGQVESTLAGIRVVKSANAQQHELGRYSTIMDTLKGEQVKMARYEAWSTPVMEMLGLVAVGFVLVFASYLVLQTRTLSVEKFMAIMIALVVIGESLRRISKLNVVLQRSNAAAGRIFEVLEMPAEAAETAAIPLAFQHSVRFENVELTYPGADHQALCGVSLEIAKGQSVAIVGRNGSGKTTLLSLLPRFYDPDAGRVFIDQADIKTVPLDSLRAIIGLVTQDAIVFPGTIADNIAYGLRDVTREDVIHAARQANAHDFILQKPLGYDTIVEGLGGQLSGGQRQRLNIARAILRKTPILILDEATSQVDAESEAAIQDAIAQLMKDRTTFVIAHRFSTIMNADLIAVMDQGKIIATGTHETLLLSCETYRILYQRQLAA